MGKNKKNKVGKKKIDIEKLLTAIIIIGLSIFLSISYYHKRKMLKDSKITTCIVVGFNEEPGTRWGYQVNVCYYVNEKKYFHRVSVSGVLPVNEPALIGHGDLPVICVGFLLQYADEACL